MSSLPSNIEDALQKQRRDVEGFEQKRQHLAVDLTSKAAKLVFLENKIKRLEASYVSREKVLRGELSKIEAKTQAAMAEATVQQDKTQNLVEETKRKQGELQALELDITTRSAYQSDQEQQIEKLTSDWQEAIRDMKASYNKLDSDKTGLLQDIVRLNQDKTEFDNKLNDVKRSIVLAEAKLSSVDAIYSEKKASYEKQLAALLEEARHVARDSEELERTTIKRADRLDYREKALDVRTELVETAENELEMNKRRLASDLSIRRSGRL